jgi:phosphoenolpyruvate carboxykinase (ATP)
VEQELFDRKLEAVLAGHPRVVRNRSRRDLIADAVARGEAVRTSNGALATWTPKESTGRAPADTVTVRRPESEGEIDWDSPNNLPIAPDTFDMLLEDAFENLPKKGQLYVGERVVGAESTYALPVRVVSYWALTDLFCDNMFRPTPRDIDRSVFAERPFNLLVLPYDKLDRKRYEGRLRKVKETGLTSNMVVAMDLDRRQGVVYGSAYGGSVKKLIFTVMNYLLPSVGVLPLHCSANEGPDGDSALLLGLSGTGKTTLSADPRRALLGDDEHGWSDGGIWNFENGCYAKLIDLDPSKEPEIFNAVMHKDDYLSHGAIVENAMMYPDGHFDFYDDRLTPNSRASYPLTYLSNIKASAKAGHPGTILFLTADANGVLPPVSRLTEEQAMFWFLMGYTSKLAGTETGVIDPVTVFSRFFGQPFMPRNPDVYARMLGEKLRQHGTKVYLVNTGWSGGPYGTGKRMDINLTREFVQAALSGQLAEMECDTDPIFKVLVPRRCPGVEDASMLVARNTWSDAQGYEQRARKLAGEFAAHFKKAYGTKGIDPVVAAQCPGA